MKPMQLSSNKIPFIVSCPTSKSYAARALICASLLGRDAYLYDLPTAQDTVDLIQILQKIGLQIENGIVRESFPECEIKSKETIKLLVGEGGTTIRFILPVLALGENSYELIFDGEMINRPMDPIYQTLTELDVKIEKTKTGVIVQGPLNRAKMVTVDTNLSSQFASAFELLKIKGIRNVEIKNLNHSQKYYLMTKKLVEHFFDYNEYTIPVDMSSLGYFLCWAALNQDLIIKNVLKPDELQADSKIFDYFKELGVKYQFSKKGLTVFKSDVKKGLIVDGRECIDLVPTLIYLASFIPYESRFNHIEKLKYKESNRLEECLNILVSFNIEHHYNSEQLIISGKQNFTTRKSKYTTQPDHRMIMISSLFLKQFGGGEICPSDNINKSFPEFFHYFS